MADSYNCNPLKNKYTARKGHQRENGTASIQNSTLALSSTLPLSRGMLIAF